MRIKKRLSKFGEFVLANSRRSVEKFMRNSQRVVVQTIRLEE